MLILGYGIQFTPLFAFHLVFCEMPRLCTKYYNKNYEAQMLILGHGIYLTLISAFHLVLSEVTSLYTKYYVKYMDC